MTTSQYLSFPIFVTTFIVSSTKDLTWRRFWGNDTKEITILPSLFHIRNLLFVQHNFSRRKASKATTQYFLFISIYWWPCTQQLLYCNVSFCISINLLKLFLRFILLLPCSLYVGGYGSHTCCCAEIFVWIVWKISKNYLWVSYKIICV